MITCMVMNLLNRNTKEAFKQTSDCGWTRRREVLKLKGLVSKPAYLKFSPTVICQLVCQDYILTIQNIFDYIFRNNEVDKSIFWVNKWCTIFLCHILNLIFKSSWIKGVIKKMARCFDNHLWPKNTGNDLELPI